MGLTSSLYHTLFKAHASGFQLATCRGQEGIFFLNDVFPKASGMPTAGDETLDREDQGSELTLSSISLTGAWLAGSGSHVTCVTDHHMWGSEGISDWQ